MDWGAVPGTERARAEAAGWFRQTYSGRPLVLKDPRLCLTLPFWRDAIPASMGAVLVLRDPIDVAHSLRARDGIPMTLALAMWDRYLRSAVAVLEGMPTLVVEYDTMLTNPVKASETVSSFLEQLGVPVEGESRDAAAQRLEPRLRHKDRGETAYDLLVQDQRDLLAAVAEFSGPHQAWQAPPLPMAPAWVEDVLRLRREFAAARHELHWVKASRTYRMAATMWRLTGRGPREFSAPSTDSNEDLA
jgi:hypothetical protein